MLSPYLPLLAAPVTAIKTHVLSVFLLYQSASSLKLRAGSNHR